MPCSMIGSLASKESCDTRLAGTAALFSNHITGKKTVGTLARIVMPLTGAKSTFIWNLLQRLTRRTNLINSRSYLAVTSVGMPERGSTLKLVPCWTGSGLSPDLTRER